MNTTNHVITFALDGKALDLWTEAVPLHELGRLNIHGASQVEFNPSKQVLYPFFKPALTVLRVSRQRTNG
jgi:hypothetical protein